MTLNEQAQQISQETAGKVLIAVGGGSTVVQYLTEWASVFVTWGNVSLLAGGLYLMYHKIFDKRRNRRDTD